MKQNQFSMCPPSNLWVTSSGSVLNDEECYTLIEAESMIHNKVVFTFCVSTVVGQ